MVFAGTTVVNGSAVCLVVHTGMATEIGKIHSQIHEALQEDDDTPLKKKLNEFGGGTSLDAVAAAIQALEEKFKLIRANDDATVLDALSFSTPKIRLLRSLTVEKKNSVQDLQA
ncbi:hypothetical protein ZWY2020_022246 [Hordeum vulgare]|nr:hypothetical protein ZWY2020_022246 [Hordeum vulgare]